MSRGSDPTPAGAPSPGAAASGVAPSDAAPLASVVITAYATAAHLLDISLGSLRAQTLERIEIVLVVDGELPPDTDEVVAAHARDPRVVVLRPGRVGRARALNLGISAARAPLVGIQDADDASHPHRLEVQVGIFDEVPRLGLLGTGAVITSSPTGGADWPLPEQPPAVHVLGREVLRSNPIVHSSVLARRSAIDRVGGYDEERTAQFDYDLILRLAADGAVLAVCDTPLVIHRRHSGQFFEGLDPVRRAWGSSRLQISHISRVRGLRRVGYYGIATGRFAYQVARGLAWHRASERRAAAAGAAPA